jgi:hypothetical protein
MEAKTKRRKGKNPFASTNTKNVLLPSVEDFLKLAFEKPDQTLQVHRLNVPAEFQVLCFKVRVFASRGSSSLQGDGGVVISYFVGVLQHNRRRALAPWWRRRCAICCVAAYSCSFVSS